MKTILLTLPLLFCSYLLSAQGICEDNTNSLEFNGVSSYVDVTNSSALAINNTLTVEAWINPLAFGTTSAQNSIFCKHGWSSGEGGYVLRCGGNGEASFNIAGLDPSGNPVSWIEVASQANSIPLNAWTHLAGTFDGDTLSLFVNGFLVAQTSFQGSITGSSSYSPKIGRLADSFSGRFFNGLIDEVRVWSRELNAVEINDRMNRHLNPAAETGLAGYWRFNEGSGTTTADFAQTGGSAGIIGALFASPVPFTGAAITAAISALDSTTICASETTSLLASPNGSGYSFLWSNGVTDSIAVVNTQGNYFAIVTDGNGCSDTSNYIQVVVNPDPVAPVLTQVGNDIAASSVFGIYQWFKDGVPFNDDFTVSNAASGSYVLTVEDSTTGCTASSNLLTISTGMEEIFNGIRIFPNPSSGDVFIQQESGSEQCNWQLYDLSGRAVRAGVLPGLHDARIRLGELDSGTYLLRMQIQGRWQQQRLVKQ
jgi:hypothetical protein